jgi:hypothetical protein
MGNPAPRCAVVDVTMDCVQVQEIVLVIVDGQAPDVQQPGTRCTTAMDGVQVQEFVLVIVDGQAPDVQQQSVIHTV